MQRALLIAFSLLCVPLAAHAIESAATVSPRATVSLASEADSYQPGHAFRLGLRFRLAPGWHIYWQNPGDAGSPPEITWKLPTGAQAGPIHWPTPISVAEGPVVSYAYTGELVLPVVIRPAPGREPLTVQADANWLICAKICVPEEGHFNLSLPAGPATASADGPLFAAADTRTPQPSPFDARLSFDGRLTMTGEGLSRARVADAWFFPTAWGPIDQNAPQTLESTANGVTLRLKPGAQFQPGQPVSGVLVLRDPEGGESYLNVTTTPATQPAGIGLVRALLFALAGGLILNLMPCVFPVLAMKALGIARLSGQERRKVRAHALSYTAGVLFAFLALGGMLLGLRAVGVAAGWGFQYQSPLFVAVIAWLLFGIGLNLSGVYQIGGRHAGVGQEVVRRRGHVGSFATGLLAAVVATPCTAPFMATAVAAAAAAPPTTALGIWVALGLGLALPYALLAAVPRLAGLLPRPGAWMELLRQVLAFPMYAAAIWLLWVASRQSGPTGVLVVGGGMGLLGFGAWALGHAQCAQGHWRHAGRAIALIAGVAAVSLLVPLGPAAPGARAAGDGSEPFSNARLAALRAEGRPVFVDMTAAWCVTCLVNERVALSPPAVREAFAAHDVAYLKGDWTRQDPEITAYLHASGRNGVPLYVYYPLGGDPVVLPQILTSALVLAELQSHQN